MSTLAHALLIIHGPDGTIGILATNFPVVPTGSQIEIHLGQDHWLENALIERYTVSNRFGVEVWIDLNTDEEYIDRDWKKIADVCAEDGTICEMMYTSTVDFSAYRILAPGPARKRRKK